MAKTPMKGAKACTSEPTSTARTTPKSTDSAPLPASSHPFEVALNQVELEERYCKTAIQLSAASASLQPGYPVGHGDHRIFR
jgi:hypothetical protein